MFSEQGWHATPPSVKHGATRLAIGALVLSRRSVQRAARCGGRGKRRPRLAAGWVRRRSKGFSRQRNAPVFPSFSSHNTCVCVHAHLRSSTWVDSEARGLASQSTTYLRGDAGGGLLSSWGCGCTCTLLPASTGAPANDLNVRCGTSSQHPPQPQQLAHPGVAASAPCATSAASAGLLDAEADLEMTRSTAPLPPPRLPPAECQRLTGTSWPPPALITLLGQRAREGT